MTPHFASGAWPTPYGRVAGLEQTAVNMLAATASTQTEGTDQLTYTALRTGPFRVNTFIHIRTASTAGTSHTVAAQVAYNAGAAISAADINNAAVAVTDINAKTLDNTLGQSQTIFAVAGTNIVITVLHTVTGTGTGTYDLMFTIEAL